MALYPFNFLNRRGLPAVESTAVSANTANVVYTFAPHSFANTWGMGVVLVRLAQDVPAGTGGTLPVVFSTNGVTTPLTYYGGTAVTAQNIPGIGVYLVYFDKASNTLQLMTGYSPAAATDTDGGDGGTTT